MIKKNMKVLANDGLEASGIEGLEKKGFEVITKKVSQDELINYINTQEVQVLLVRSATKVRKDIIDNCPSLKIIGRGGVGMDNIDVEYARSQGIQVINTPEASSQSVAELVFAHLFSGARFLEDSNRKMPIIGRSEFAQLKKNYSSGVELRGKTLGIVGLGRIGQEVARIALGLGMKVIAADKHVGKATIKVTFFNNQFINVDIETESLEDVLKQSDFITFHVPAQKDGYIIDREEFEIMKDGVAVINCSRGGIIHEEALLEALDKGKVSFAGLDVYENEPTPSDKLLNHARISFTPHTGASTLEAQERIAASLVDQISSIFLLS